MNFKNEIASLISKYIEFDINEIIDTIEIPPDLNVGDFAFPCFKLSKALKKSPALIATDLVSQISCDCNWIDNIVANGPYINFFINKSILVSDIINQVIEFKDNYGKSNIGTDKTIVIDYSSPNLAKEFHIGHLFTTVIGNSLYKVYKYLGYNAVGINYIGDWGTQFGKLIVAYKLWGNKEDIELKGVQELTRLYVKFHSEAELNPPLEDDARLWFMNMQNGNQEALDLWKWFREVCLEEIEKTYKRLNVTFDSYRGESYYNDKMIPIVDELKKRNLLVESDGAMIVDLEEYKMPPCLILRRDGGTLYPTRDIASAFDRKNLYNFYKAIYVTDLRQSMHFSQFFKVIGLMGYEWEKDLVHVPYGLLSLETGSMSSRKGNVILLDDLFNEASSRVLNIINEKNPSLNDKEEVAEKVGVGAVIFSTLYNSRIKDVVFSWDKILNFEGETGPYVQYTYARACSVLNKANFDIEKAKTIDFSLLNDDESVRLVKLISIFTDKLIEVTNKLEPFVLSRYVMDLSQNFNKFYHENPILTSETNLKDARLVLVYCVKIVLKNSLELLGISCPEKM